MGLLVDKDDGCENAECREVAERGKLVSIRSLKNIWGEDGKIHLLGATPEEGMAKSQDTCGESVVPFLPLVSSQ